MPLNDLNIFLSLDLINHLTDVVDLIGSNVKFRSKSYRELESITKLTGETKSNWFSEK